MKVAIIYPSPAPYREKFFAEFSKLPEIELCVYYCAQQVSYRNWKFSQDEYRKKFLAGREFGAGLLFNPEVLVAMRRERPDIIVTWGWSFPTAIINLVDSYLVRVPVVLFSDTALPYQEYPPIPKLLLQEFKRLIVKLPQAFIAQGKMAREFLIALGAFKERIHILPINCIDVGFWQKTSALARGNCREIKKRCGINGKKVFLFLGNLEPRKGILPLLDAMALLNREKTRAMLLVVGDGPQRQELEARAAELNLDNCWFMGNQPYENLPLYAGLSDCLVLPTLADHWPLVLLEGLACGLPVITTSKCLSVPELLESMETGLVVDPSNSTSLAAAMRKILLMSSEERQAMADRAINVAWEYDYRSSAKKFAKVLREELLMKS